MFQFYPNLSKKSIVAIFLASFVLWQPTVVLALEPNDLFYSQQAKIWQQIKALQAWDLTTGNKKIVVAVIDIGVDTWHPDLYQNIWVNPNEIEGNGFDDDGNGYIDDINGWNFVEENNDPRVSVMEKNLDKDAISHGTIVSGIIGAVGNNRQGATGLNWDVSIMALRAINNNGMGSYSNIARAINYAIDNGANIINLSFVGNDPDEEFKKVLKNAYGRGIFIVSAAGNSGHIIYQDGKEKFSYPACYDIGEENWIMGVSSVDSKDAMSYFSAYGKCVDILAPGEGIYSLQRFSPQYDFFEEVGGPWQGTSFSTAFISGAAALIKSLHPEWTPAQIRDNLIQTADDLFFDINGSGSRLYKRLNVGRAVEIANQSKVGLDNLDGFYFYRNGKNNNSEILRYNLGKRETTSTIRLAGKIVALSSKDIDNDGSKESIIVLQQGSTFSLKAYTQKGVLVRDFVLAKNVKDHEIYGVKFDLDGNKQIDFVVAKYYPAQKVTKFVKYNWHGKYLNEFGLVGKVVGWETNNMFLYAATLVNRNLFIREIDWGGNIISEIKFSNIFGVDSFKVGHVDSLKSDQIVFIARKKDDTELYTVDWNSLSFYRKKIENKIQKQYLLLGKYQDDLLQNIFVFNLKKGEYNIQNSQGKILKTYTLPDIIGSVEQ